MTYPEIILLILCIALLIAVITLLLLNIRIHKDVDNLSDSIDKFIEKDIPIEFSTKDNHFARLHNSVADLENLYQFEQNNTIKESKKNTEFISDISHQLKTPLAAMRLYVEMENCNSPNAYTKKEIQLIDKMENLIYSLLRLEKIKSDAYVMEFEKMDVYDIATEVISSFTPLFPDKKYTVTGHSAFRLDKMWLSEAIANVVKNASEHTDENGEIDITIENSEKSTTVSVRDNGSGVPEEELTMLFKRFHRTANANPNSAGIGLSITKAVVEKHHGTILAENVDKGLSIIMCFPHIDGYITI